MKEVQKWVLRGVRGDIQDEPRKREKLCSTADAKTMGKCIVQIFINRVTNCKNQRK